MVKGGDKLQRYKFEYITSHCSYFDEKITVLGRFAELNVLGQTQPIYKFMSHDCKHYSECNRNANDCDLYRMGVAMSR